MLNLKKKLVLCMAALAMFSVLTACGSTESSTTTSTDEAAPSAQEETADSAENEDEEKTVIRIDSETVFGDAIDSSVFAENDVTLVNLFATWCGPCVGEIPDLQEIAAADNQIGVIGIVADTYDAESGETVQEAIDTAKDIAAQTGAEYPFIIPDAAFMEETMNNAAALFPMSFLVDQEGNVIQGPIGGARSEQEWLDLIAEATAE